MNGRVARQLRRALFDEMVSSGTILQSGYALLTVRRGNGERAQMLVGTGFRKLYQEMKHGLKVARRGVLFGNPPGNDGVRARRRRARARARAEYRRRAVEILAARKAAA